MVQRSSLRAVLIAMLLLALFIAGIYGGQHIGLLPRM
ncbi:hypothetical protein Rleg4DRAFT_4380 [Rhizobium leguminosarum bv. trifolii WSM2297]|uniref:Uncharacterized protein n=1 Tax=Rhizobium leguminosarum bv. trifolii WSM2297 TaxID=754762 RepID=J0WA70_RHILT|nr:hypothetical protein Rleg4DRAFT_4380 [Rhizobium leguminosarum bv. trifolii WSM2297]